MKLTLPIDAFEKYESVLEVGKEYSICLGQILTGKLMKDVCIDLTYVCGEGTILPNGEIKLDLKNDGHHVELIKRGIVRICPRAIFNRDTSECVKLICFDMQSKLPDKLKGDDLGEIEREYQCDWRHD